MTAEHTSQSAHHRTKETGKTTAQRERILAAFRERDDWTCGELVARFAERGELDLAQKSTMAPRVFELIAEGSLRVDGARTCAVSGMLVRRLRRYLTRPVGAGNTAGEKVTDRAKTTGEMQGRLFDTRPVDWA